MQKTVKKTEKRRSGFAVMAGLIGMIRPLLPVMTLAILMGCVGNLMASFLTILGGYGLLAAAGFFSGSLKTVFGLIIVFAVLRGVLRYAEQASNHYIAFKLLAQIRHKVFAALRRLCPAKLDGSEKGDLISVITSDIELLEVFYAHTISPIAIAVLTSGFMVWFIGRLHPALGVLAAVCYLLVGAVIPIWNGKRGGDSGQRYRDSFGALNTVVLDNLYGLDEILQYGQQEQRLSEMRERTRALEEENRTLKNGETAQRVVTDGVILFAGVLMAAALSALSNNLHHTLASGNRVLSILEEEPLVEDVTDGAEQFGGNIVCDGVSFSYDRRKEVLSNFSRTFAENKIHGILGKSGCGKSTLLKLLMRFYETDAGSIRYGDTPVGEIRTAALRQGVSYVTQETFLFGDTIENNIKVAKEDAGRDEVITAAKKAAIHEFIMSLPNGYDTKLAELGDSVSGGERQRIGLARAFLHDGSMIFLDEPTSNIDSLNEGIILRSLEREKQNKTILLVSHRRSTMGIVDDMAAM